MNSSASTAGRARRPGASVRCVLGSRCRDFGPVLGRAVDEEIPGQRFGEMGSQGGQVLADRLSQAQPSLRTPQLPGCPASPPHAAAEYGSPHRTPSTNIAFGCRHRGTVVEPAALPRFMFPCEGMLGDRSYEAPGVALASVGRDRQHAAVSRRSIVPWVHARHGHRPAVCERAVDGPVISSTSVSSRSCSDAASSNCSNARASASVSGRIEGRPVLPSSFSRSLSVI